MGLAITETNDNVSSLYPECHAQCQYYIVIELCGVLLCKGMVQNDALQHKVDDPDPRGGGYSIFFRICRL